MTNVEESNVTSPTFEKTNKTLVVTDLVKHFPGGRSALNFGATKQWVRAQDGLSFDIAP